MSVERCAIGGANLVHVEALEHEALEKREHLRLGQDVRWQRQNSLVGLLERRLGQRLEEEEVAIDQQGAKIADILGRAAGGLKIIANHAQLLALLHPLEHALVDQHFQGNVLA